MTSSSAGNPASRAAPTKASAAGWSSRPRRGFVSVGPVRTTRRIATLMGFDLRLTRPLLNLIVDEAMAAGLGARALAGIAERVCRRALYEMPDRIRGVRTQTAVVTLGVDAIRDGSYRLEWRAGRAETTPKRLMAEDEANGKGGETGTSMG